MSRFLADQNHCLMNNLRFPLFYYLNFPARVQCELLIVFGTDQWILSRQKMILIVENDSQIKNVAVFWD